jgi:hypothetical protein
MGSFTSPLPLIVPLFKWTAHTGRWWVISYRFLPAASRPVPIMHTRSHQKKEKQVRSNSWWHCTKKKIQTGPPTTGFACARVKSKFCLKDICPVDHKIRTKICAQQILLDMNFSTNLVVHDSSAGTLGAKKKNCVHVRLSLGYEKKNCVHVPGPCTCILALAPALEPWIHTHTWHMPCLAATAAVQDIPIT